MQTKLWNRNFTLLIAATGLGAIGGIAGGFAMSFLVFDETGSTMASALVLAAQLIPGFLLPLVIAPWMDRMPRKPFWWAATSSTGSCTCCWDCTCCGGLFLCGLSGLFPGAGHPQLL